MVLAIAALLSRLGLRIVAGMHTYQAELRLEFKALLVRCEGGEYQALQLAQLEHCLPAERTSSTSSGYIGVEQRIKNEHSWVRNSFFYCNRLEKNCCSLFFFNASRAFIFLAEGDREPKVRRALFFFRLSAPRVTLYK